MPILFSIPSPFKGTHTHNNKEGKNTTKEAICCLYIWTFTNSRPTTQAQRTYIWIWFYSADTRILQIHNVRTIFFGQCRFSYCAPNQWNFLPSATFNPLTPSKLHSRLTSTNTTNSIFLLASPIYPPLPLLCVCVCVCVIKSVHGKGSDSYCNRSDSRRPSIPLVGKIRHYRNDRYCYQQQRILTT